MNRIQYLLTGLIALTLVLQGCDADPTKREKHGDDRIEDAALAAAAAGGDAEAASAAVPIKELKVRYWEDASRVFLQRNGQDEAVAQLRLPDLDFDAAYGRIFHDGKEGAKFDVKERRGKFTRVTIKKGIEYRVKIYLHKDGKYVARADSPELVVGDIFIVAGQSNSTNSGSGKTSSKTDGAFMFTGETFKKAEDPYYTTEDGSYGSSPWPNFSDFYYQGTGVPVAVYSIGHGQTYVSEWTAGGKYYPRLEKAVKLFGKNGFRAFLWHQGESDVWRGTKYWDYFNAMNYMILGLRNTIGWGDMPVFVANTSYPGKTGYNSLCSSLGGYPACVGKIASNQQHVITGQQYAWTLHNVFPGSNTDALWEDKFRDIGGYDVHMNETGQYHHGWRWYDAVKQKLPKIP